MQYWARINGKDYPIVYGFTYTEELSENLDSASINLAHISGELSIKPYDDVIIHDYGYGLLPPHPFGKRFVPEGGHFYRHMLVHSYTREKISLAKIEGKYRYNFHIDLISETKGLETVQLPNKTITQPRGTGDKGASSPNFSNVSFFFGDYPKYTLPYGTVNKYQNGLLVANVHEGIGSYLHSYLFAGDVDYATSDYSMFSVVYENMKIGTRFFLPDWNVSGVTLVNERMILLIRSVLKVETIHPIKHWIIRKKGISDNLWNTRNACLAKIKSYLAAVASGSDVSALFPEIVNTSFGLDADITDSNAVSTISATAPLSVGQGETFDDYAIYLYVEPKLCKLVDDSEINVFGMTNNSTGATAPTENDEFLAMWETRVSLEESYVQKGVLTVYEAVRQALSLYNPYIKETSDGNQWHWRGKYTIDPLTRNKFMGVIAPENQWNYPNLRDFITRLFYVADCIPVVHDGEIGHLDLSKRDPIPFDYDPKRISYDQESMDGNSYCDRLLRNYSNGLSKDNVVQCVERIGFKNADSPTLTLENLRLELSHPIYRVNKVYMCYYNRFVGVGEGNLGNNFMRLCKQDITPLVILNAQRNLLSEDWNSLQNVNDSPHSIEDLAKFKYATIGYDIGSDKISGWGAKYEFPTNVFWTATKTVIENIFDFTERLNPIGVRMPEETLQEYAIDETFDSNANVDREAVGPIDPSDRDQGYETKQIPNSSLTGSPRYKELFGNYTEKLKSLVFIVEYEGFVSGAIIAAKDVHDGNVVSRDNQSASLSFLESDGVNQKEKANRLGNATVTCSGRYSDFDDIGKVSQVLNGDGHKDEVLFKKTVRFDVDSFTASYFFCRDFVLRNYFTSVFSKHRPFALASYGESVERQENKTLQILLSPDKFLYQNESNRIKFDGDLGKLFSFFVGSEYDSNGNVSIAEGIDTAYYSVYPSRTNSYKGQIGSFAVDMQKFTSGNSLCFVVAMKDNVSGGVFVSDFNHELSSYVWETISNTIGLAGGFWDLGYDQTVASNLLTGAKQDWHMFPVDPRTGMLYNMSFSVGYKSNDAYAVDGMKAYSKYDIATAQLLPLMDCLFVRTNGTPIYFGGVKEISNESYMVGAGYPRISFVKNGDWYKAEIENDAIGLVAYNPQKFATADGDILTTPRPRINEFACAVFKGSETESSWEYDDCVFKDGKERIVTTLQFEPISEDNRVSFSELMFKLSDVMGGKEKNYREVDISNKILFKKGVSNLHVIWNEYVYDPDRNTVYNMLFSVPTMSICIPRDIILEGLVFDIDETMELRSSSDNSVVYSIHAKTGSLSVDGKSLNVVCDISFQGQTTLEDETVVFHDLEQVGSYIPGRTGVSDYDPVSMCFREGYGYRSFAFVEDYFFFGNGTENVTISYNAFSTHTGYFLHNIYAANVTDPSLYYYFGNTPTAQFDYWQVFVGNGINYRNIEWYDYRWYNDPTQRDISVEQSVYNITEVGPNIGPETKKLPNMTWVFTSDKMDANTPYETLYDLPGKAFVSYDGSSAPYEDKFIPGANIYIGSDAGGKPRITIVPPFPLTGSGSFRLYYKEEGVHRFVFGVNVDDGDTGDDDCIHPGSDGNYQIYVSVVDDRSRTVIDAVTGDPLYETKNFASEPDAVPSNICVAK